MNIDFSGDDTFKAAIAAGVKAAMLDPEFRRAMVADLVLSYLWLTQEEAAALVRRNPKTISRWAKKHKVTVSYSHGPKEPRYLAGELHRAMLTKEVAAQKKAEPKPGSRLKRQFTRDDVRFQEATLI